MAKSQKEILLERKKMILAMEYICRHVYDKNILDAWTLHGVPDKSIPYGSFDTNVIDDGNDMIANDDKFRKIMDCFLNRMSGAKISGGLICDNVQRQYKGRPDVPKPKKNGIIERKKMILSMEFICRQINDEDVFDGWLLCGVPDGDIPYGNFDTDTIYSEDNMVVDNDDFLELMDCFLRRMEGAKKSGGLWCGDVVTEAG